MRKVVFLLSFILFFFLSSSAFASSLLRIDKEGNLTVNVLSAQSQTNLVLPNNGILEIKKIANVMTGEDEIVLRKEGERYNLYFDESNSIDITNWKESVVQIEEKEENKEADILLENGEFSLVQAGVRANIPFPIKINPKKKKFQLETPYGDKYLAVLPFEAALISLRSKSLSKLDEAPFKLLEENKDIVYHIFGKKTINFFNVYNLDTSVVAKVSASTGEVINVEEPLWLKLLSIFLT